MQVCSTVSKHKDERLNMSNFVIIGQNPLHIRRYFIQSLKLVLINDVFLLKGKLSLRFGFQYVIHKLVTDP